MKKIVAALILSFLATGISFPVEAGIKSKITDLIKRRKNDSDSSSIEKISSSLKGLSSSFSSSGSNQFSYISKNFLNSDEDLSFLMAYGYFAKNGEMFFSLLESLLSKLRTEYASLLGAQNRLEKASSERSQTKLDNSIDKYKTSVNRCIEILGSKGIAALAASLQCSTIILLKVAQDEVSASPANKAALKKQIESFIQKYSSTFENISNDLSANISAIQEASESGLDISSQVDVIVSNVSLLHNALKALNKHLVGKNISEK